MKDKLTEAAIKNAKPKDKSYRMVDGAGLYLEVAPSGGKWWRLKYRFGGKEKRLSLGVYPATGLAQARRRRDEARQHLSEGVDPSVAKQEKRQLAAEQGTTFKDVALEWFERKRPNWTEGTANRIKRRLEKELLPPLGRLPIAKVAPKNVLEAVQAIEGRGLAETAKRALQDCGMIFRYAVLMGRVEIDPCPSLRGALVGRPVQNHASVTDPRAVGALLRAIWGYEGSPVTCAALKLAAYTFVRPGELRHAEWSEIDTEAAEWRIPAHKMKMRTPHVVPLSRQALEVLAWIHPFTGATRYVFPSERSAARPMSENTVNGSLRRLGFSKEEMTGHGFRSMASTLLNEQGWRGDVVERQLAHAERNSVRASYNFAEFLPERRRMMQAWSDYLDGLREGGKVVPLFASAGGAE